MDPIIITGHVRVNATASTRGLNFTLGPKQQLDEHGPGLYYARLFLSLLLLLLLVLLLLLLFLCYACESAPILLSTQGHTT